MRHNTTPTTRALTALLLCITAMFMPLSACGHPQAEPAPQPKTEKITYPASIVRDFFYTDDIRTPKAAAADLKTSGPKYLTDARAKPNGDIVITVTEQQRHNNITYNNQRIKHNEQEFTKANPDYHYAINQNGTSMNVWTDKNLSFFASFAIFTEIPSYNGLNYYMKHGKGVWDMQITIYNCHTNQPITTFKASEGFHLNQQDLGD
ncbi:hypothetical protein [Bifidobacterium sp. ESL0704]|uniref:hypothetical protein n=1 Tax=Bifidobacterium sp. ESL0704 TaxID=2983219 RepID=UPI0023F8162A|nr:hypothetical protein [Bifidobacterium sp. ESL0704]WEV52972.1 hypothetical protein OZX64_00205 [Bifidobacterium sp. ESL0704]